VTDEQAGATRYRMLETVRQYALDRLRETGEEAQWRHRQFARSWRLPRNRSSR
jgi:predicted ATPase